jgi:hypothetical protein
LLQRIEGLAAHVIAGKHGVNHADRVHAHILAQAARG